ncbi:MAG: CorA family divalent cation transporter [Dongiaceae bacterium]
MSAEPAPPTARPAVLPAARPAAGPLDPGEGLAFAVALAPGGRPRPLRDWPAVDAALADPAAAVWVHLNGGTNQARTWLTERSRLPADAVERLLDDDPRTCLEVVREGLFGVLTDLHRELDGRSWEIGQLRLWVDRRRLVTVRHHPLRAAARLRRKLRDGLEVATAPALAGELMHALAEELEEAADDLTAAVDEIEDDVLAGHGHHHRRRLGEVRRPAARLVRHVPIGRHASARLALRPPTWLAAGELDELRDGIERLAAVVDDLTGLQERAKLLEEELAARLAEATNRNLYALSIITALFLPMTLLTGVFGMNVAGLPWTQGQGGFAWTMGLMLGVALVTLGLLRWLRLL